MDTKETRRHVAPPLAAPLPADRAFVVKFQAGRVAAEDLFVGRAEHIASGTAVRFTCAAGLIAFIAEVLAPGEPQAEPHARETAEHPIGDREGEARMLAVRTPSPAGK